MSTVPTLSTVGWVNTVDKKADVILGHFFLSDYSQSVLYKGNVKSLPYIIAELSNKPLLLKARIYESLVSLMQPFFEQVQIDVAVEEDKLDDSKLTITISATVFERGVSYDMAYLVNAKDTLMTKYAKLNNG